MAELTISSDEIRGALERYVSSYTPEISREEVGIVADAGDGIAHVEGLPSTMASELLEFQDGTLGVALNLDVRDIGVVVLGDFSGIAEGQRVKRTGRVLSVPVGDAFLGRVVDPLGKPLDAMGEIDEEEYRELELQAPNVMARQGVTEPLQTGIKAIDSMTPIGRGQRELLIGDRKTGKTTVAIDTIINQRDNWLSGDPKKQVRCIYVAIGQKASTVSSVKGTLEEHGAMEYTTIVNPIPDGQIFLEADLFTSGVRPAINVGTPVSRVGGNAQVKPMRRVAGRLRLDLAQYRELEAFSAFASDLDKASRAQLDRGARLVELLKQSNYSPYPVEEEVVSIWMGTTGKVDDIPLADIRRFEREFLDYLRHSHKDTLAAIAGGTWDDDTTAKLDSAFDDFLQIFRGEGKEQRINDPPAKEMENGVETREQVRKQTRAKAEK